MHNVHYLYLTEEKKHDNIHNKKSQNEVVHDQKPRKLVHKNLLTQKQKHFNIFVQCLDCFLFVTYYNSLYNTIDNIHIINTCHKVTTCVWKIICIQANLLHNKNQNSVNISAYADLICS